MDKDTRDLLILIFLALAIGILVNLIPNNRIPKVTTNYVSHTVKQGESISSIVTVENGFKSERLVKRVQAENGSSVIMPGQKLIIPVEIEGR